MFSGLLCLISEVTVRGRPSSPSLSVVMVVMALVLLLLFDFFEDFSLSWV